VDLAIATNSTLIVSRDRHLLNLMDASRSDGKEFKDRFPDLTILTPENLIQQLLAQERL
jgi:predicted nucleic acid-binding protein